MTRDEMLAAVRRLIHAAERYADRIDAEAPAGQVSNIVAPMWRLLAAEAKAEIESLHLTDAPSDAMPPVEVGDWVWRDGSNHGYTAIVVQPHDVTHLSRPTVAVDITEIRKANGRVWRRGDAPR